MSDPLSSVKQYLSFNRGMAVATSVYSALIVSLQVILDSNTQVGQCTDFAQFLFWVGFAALVCGSLADFFFDFSRLIRQHWNDILSFNDKVVDAGSDGKLHFLNLCFCLQLDREEAPADGQAGYYKLEGCCCNNNKCEGSWTSWCSFHGDQTNPLEFDCCGFRTNMLSPPGKYLLRERIVEDILLVWTAFIRFLSNLSLSVAIPTITMYNYLHPLPPVSGASPTPSTSTSSCFIGGDQLFNLLIGSTVAAFALIAVRALSPSWSRPPGV